LISPQVIVVAAMLHFSIFGRMVPSNVLLHRSKQVMRAGREQGFQLRAKTAGSLKLCLTTPSALSIPKHYNEKKKRENITKHKKSVL